MALPKITLSTPISESFAEVWIEEEVRLNPRNGRITGFLSYIQTINGQPQPVKSVPFSVKIGRAKRRNWVEDILLLVQAGDAKYAGSIVDPNDDAD